MRRLFMRLPVIVASICLSVLVAVWFASAAGAQVSPHASHLSHVALSTQELAVGIAHGATLGAVVFLAGLVAFVALVWFPASRVEDGDQEKTARLFCRWMWHWPACSSQGVWQNSPCMRCALLARF